MSSQENNIFTPIEEIINVFLATSVSLLLAQLESACSSISGAHQIWGLGRGETVWHLSICGNFNLSKGLGKVLGMGSHRV